MSLSRVTNHLEGFQAAAEIAQFATCYKARCGSVIIDSQGLIMGKGFNAPPLGLESQRQCDRQWDFASKPKYDRTCCIHAEWNAIFDALSQGDSLHERDATLYFMRVDAQGNWTEAGEPYCTVCSRLALQAGVKYFALWRGSPQISEAGFYNLETYNSALLS